ncbi:hypothetical protein Tco_0615434 [Tanacetum coccineum]
MSGQTALTKVSEPGGSRSRIYKVFEVEPMKEKEAGIVVICLGKNPNSSRVWPFLGVVHNSAKDARLSEAAATIIRSNRGFSIKPNLIKQKIQWFEVFLVPLVQDDVVHNSSKDARLSEAAATIIGSNRDIDLNNMSLQQFFRLHNWYQSLVARDLGSTRCFGVASIKEKRYKFFCLGYHVEYGDIRSSLELILSKESLAVGEDDELVTEKVLQLLRLDRSMVRIQDICFEDFQEEVKDSNHKGAESWNMVSAANAFFMLPGLVVTTVGLKPRFNGLYFGLFVRFDYEEDCWKRISEKRTKNQAKNDKTEHGMEKREKTKSKSQIQSQP